MNIQEFRNPTIFGVDFPITALWGKSVVGDNLVKPTVQSLRIELLRFIGVRNEVELVFRIVNTLENINVTRFLHPLDN